MRRRDKVKIDGERVILFSRGRLVDAQPCACLERVYSVHAGSDISIFTPDVEFHVFRFKDKLWVLPWKTGGVAGAVDAIWPERNDRLSHSWEAVLWEMPRDWRKSYFWGLARPPMPALRVLPRSAAALPWFAKREGSKVGGVPDHDYPYLNYLIGGYFHQDWDIAGDTLDAVIALFKDEHAAEDWTEIRGDIGRLLNRYDDAALPQEFIRLFRPDIDPEAWSGSTRKWLTQVEALLR
ncbi:MAG: hypothetical protein JOY97_06965 [Hyphomicrobiales bacterium]|nr:hypothetical protein [Hyphomicrobiales bacterium]